MGPSHNQPGLYHGIVVCQQGCFGCCLCLPVIMVAVIVDVHVDVRVDAMLVVVLVVVVLVVVTLAMMQRVSMLSLSFAAATTAKGANDGGIAERHADCAGIPTPSKHDLFTAAELRPYSHNTPPPITNRRRLCCHPNVGINIR